MESIKLGTEIREGKAQEKCTRWTGLDIKKGKRRPGPFSQALNTMGTKQIRKT